MTWSMPGFVTLPHRAGMHDLNGLDPALLCVDMQALNALDVSRLSAVRAGAFIAPAQHAKFDLTKSGACPICHVADTVQHRVCECARYQSARQGHQWICEQRSSLPESLALHLLPSSNPHLAQVRLLLQGLGDCSGEFHCSPDGSQLQHLFTDGSCKAVDHVDLALAAWGVVHAGHGLPLASGLVPGLLQTAPRAEIWAVIAAVRWILKYRVKSILWIDSQHVVDGLAALQRGKNCQNWHNSDLWRRLSSLLESLDDGLLQARHVPSHLCQTATESPFKDWLAQHNNHVDTLATVANTVREAGFQAAFRMALDYHNQRKRQLRALRAIMFGIAQIDLDLAASRREDAEEPEVELSLSAPCERRRCTIGEDLPINWQVRLQGAVHRLPWEFIRDVCIFVITQDSLSPDVFGLTFLELVFLLHLGGQLQYPISGVVGRWVVPQSVFAPLPPTVASRLGLIRRAVKHAFGVFDLSECLVSGLSRIDLGVGFPLDGLRIGCDSSLLQLARGQLRDFTWGRRVQSQGALARPL